MMPNWGALQKDVTTGRLVKASSGRLAKYLPSDPCTTGVTVDVTIASVSLCTGCYDMGFFWVTGTGGSTNVNATWSGLTLTHTGSGCIWDTAADAVTATIKAYDNSACTTFREDVNYEGRIDVRWSDSDLAIDRVRAILTFDVPGASDITLFSHETNHCFNETVNDEKSCGDFPVATMHMGTGGTAKVTVNYP